MKHLVSLFVLLFCISTLVYSLVIFVDANASFNGNGTQEVPFKFINSALTYASTIPDEACTIIIAPGEYLENVSISWRYSDLTLQRDERYPSGEFCIKGYREAPALKITNCFTMNPTICIKGITITSIPHNGIEFCSKGGGIYSERVSHVIIKNCKIRDNQANVGAGIYTSSNNCEILDSEIYNNYACGSYDGPYYITSGGGAICCANEGIYHNYAYLPEHKNYRVHVENCKIYNNRSDDYGGAITNWYDQLSFRLWATHLTIESTQMYDNHAVWGGAIFFKYRMFGSEDVGSINSSIKIRNCTLMDNWQVSPATGAVTLSCELLGTAHEGRQLINSIIRYRGGVDQYNIKSLVCSWGTQPGEYPMLIDSVLSCNLPVEEGYSGSNITSDPLFMDETNNDFRLTWNSSSKSPCIMAGINDANPLSSYYDRKDIGAIQYSAEPHEYYTYRFPPHSERNGIKWMCFSSVDNISTNPADQDMAMTLFNPLFNQVILHDIQWKEGAQSPQSILFNNTFWQGDNHVVVPWQGYKFTMSNNLESEVKLPIRGLVIDEHTPMNIISHLPDKNNNDPSSYNENWLGYFSHKTLSPFEAFQGVLENLFFIQTQNWTMVRTSLNSTSPWICALTEKPFTLSYGDMVIVKCFVDDIFQWNTTPAERAPYEKEDPEHFTYQEKTEYIPIYIDFTGTDFPKEVGVFVDDICKGAAVVKGDIVEIPAYLESEIPEGTELEIRLFYDNKSIDLTPQYSTWNNEAGVYENKNLVTKPNQDYYLVEVKTGQTGSIPNPKLFVNNYPNPFNPETSIKYYVPQDGNLTLDIYNIRGQKVRSLVCDFQKKGFHEIRWNGTDETGKQCCSGVYFSRLTAGDKVVTNKMLMLK